MDLALKLVGNVFQIRKETIIMNKEHRPILPLTHVEKSERIIAVFLVFKMGFIIKGDESQE